MRFSSRRVWLGLLILPVLLGVWMGRAASWRPKIVKVSKAAVLAFCWSKDGRTIQLATGDGHIQTLLASSLAVLSSHRGADKWDKAQFSSNGLLLTKSFDEVRLLNCASAQTIWMRSYVEENRASDTWQMDITALALAPQGDELAFGTVWGASASTYAFKIQNGHVLPDKSNSNGDFWSNLTESLVFSKRGVLAWDAAGGGAGFAVRSSQTGKMLSLAIPPQVAVEEQAMSCAFSPDDGVIAARFDAGAVVLWNAHTNQLLRCIMAHPVVGKWPLAFSPDSQCLVAGENIGKISQWNVRSGTLLRTIDTGATAVSSLSFSPDGSHLAVGTSNGQVQLWRVK